MSGRVRVHAVIGRRRKLIDVGLLPPSRYHSINQITDAADEDNLEEPDSTATKSSRSETKTAKEHATQEPAQYAATEASQETS